MKVFGVEIKKVAPPQKRIIMPNGRMLDAHRQYENLVNRIFGDNIFLNRTTDADVREAIRQYRGAARNLVHQSSMGQRFLDLVGTNVVGDTGFTLQAQTEFYKDSKNQPDMRANDIIETLWDDFSRPENISVKGDLTLRELCQTFMKGIARDGEIFVQMVRGQGKYGLMLNPIPPEFVNEYNQRADLVGGGYLWMGIEHDKYGKVLGYEVSKQDAASRSTGYVNYGDAQRIPAKDMIHLFLSATGTETRGMTWFSSVLKELLLLNRFEIAAIVGAEVGASQAVFITTEADGQQYNGADGVDQNGNMLTDLSPGIKEGLLPGQKIQDFKPAYPNTQYGEFVAAILHRIAAGLGVTYSSLTGDNTRSNFSSARVSLMEERSMWKNRQAWFAEKFLHRLFEEWLLMGIAKRVIPLSLDRIDKYKQATFVGRRFPYLQPETDAKSIALEHSSQLKTHKDILSEEGIDIENHYNQLAYEKRRRIELNIPILGMDIATGTTSPVNTDVAEAEAQSQVKKNGSMTGE